MSETVLPRADVRRATRDGRFSVARLHRTGPQPTRVLIIGSAGTFDAVCADRPVRLVDRIADGLQLGTHRGVDLDLLCEPATVLETIRRNPDFWRLWRYDLLVVVLPALRGGRPTRRSDRLRELLEAVLEGGRGRGAVLVVDPEATDRGATPLDLLHADVPSVRVGLDLRDTAGPHRLVSEMIHLVGSTLGRGAADDEDERRRQEALDELGLLEGHSDLRLDRIVRTARQGFGVAVAALNLLSRDELVTVAVEGIEPGRMPRRASLCNRAIAQDGTMVVPDTWEDPGLRGHPAIGGPHAVRFYAAHPIESIEGYRIGTLCIMDFEPHDPDAFDLSMLRDLALLAEAELVAAAR